MLPFLKEADGAGNVPLIARATQFLMQRIDSDLGIIIGDLLPNFGGQIACVTGVTINTEKCTFFCPSTQVIVNYHQPDGTLQTLELA